MSSTLSHAIICQLTLSGSARSGNILEGGCNDRLKDTGSTQFGLCDTQHVHQATSRTCPQT